MAKSPDKNMIFRSGIVLLVFFVAVGVLIFFLSKYQIIEYDLYQSRAISQQTLNTTINANRGKITDCNGVELAVSKTVKTVYISPKNIKNETQARDIAKNLSKILDVDYERVYEKTQKNNFYEVIKRKVENDIADKVREYVSKSKVTGVHLIDDTKRYYPYNNLASHIIGFVGTDNTGLDGVELTYNKYLSGTNGKLITAKNNAGSELPIEYETYVPAQDGNTVKLTIDSTVQYYLEKHIEQAREDNKCLNGAAGIIMDVNTGAILAMTSKPDYDLNA
jgi:stage V sporulation protein D (sporulation-specific penicillin-binding protein)